MTLIEGEGREASESTVVLPPDVMTSYGMGSGIPSWMVRTESDWIPGEGEGPNVGAGGCAGLSFM